MTGIAKKDLLMKRKHLEIGLFSKFSSIQIQAVFVISILLLLISSVIYIFFEDYCVNEYRDSNFYYNQLSMNDATESLESWVQTKEESMKKTIPEFSNESFYCIWSEVSGFTGDFCGNIVESLGGRREWYRSGFSVDKG